MSITVIIIIGFCVILLTLFLLVRFMKDKDDIKEQ